MGRKWFGAVLLACWIAGTISSFPNSGVGLGCDFSGCAVYAKAGPAELAVSFLLAGFMLGYPQRPATVIAGPPVSVIRQVAALFVDTGVIMLIAFPACTLVILAIEAMQTGTFAWAFQRSFVRMSDFSFAVSMLISFVALFGYFHWHITRGRRTAGEYLLGYMTVPTTGEHPDAWRHTWRVIGGLFLWPFAVLVAAQHTDKTMWWNRASGLKAALVA